MKFVGCMLIAMVVSLFIFSLLKKHFKGILILKHKYKYYFISFCISLLVGIFVCCFVDYSKNMFLAGFLWGIFDCIIQLFISYEKK